MPPLAAMVLTVTATAEVELLRVLVAKAASLVGVIEAAERSQMRSRAWLDAAPGYWVGPMCLAKRRPARSSIPPATFPDHHTSSGKRNLASKPR